MPVTAEWLDDDRTIVRFNYDGNWEWEEAFQVVNTGNEMMKQVDHPVAVVVDMTNGQQLPPNPLQNIQKLSRGRGQHPNDSGITVFLNAEVLTKAMQDVLEMTGAQLPPGLSATYARTLDEAIKQANLELARYNDVNQ